MAFSLEKQHLRNKEGLLGSRRRPENGDWPLASSENFFPIPQRWLTLRECVWRSEVSALKRALWSPAYVCVYTWSTFTLSRCDFSSWKHSQSRKKRVGGKTVIGMVHQETKILSSSTPSKPVGLFCGTLKKISVFFEVREVQWTLFYWTKTVIKISSFVFHYTNDQPYLLLHSSYTETTPSASKHTLYWTQGACQAESGRYFCCAQYSEWIQLNWTPSHGTQTLNAFSRGPNSTECSPFTLRKYNQTAVNQVGGRWERQRGVKSDCLRRAKLLGCADWRI